MTLNKLWKVFTVKIHLNLKTIGIIHKVSEQPCLGTENGKTNFLKQFQNKIEFKVILY
jgi:hypothetical protein